MTCRGCEERREIMNRVIEATRRGDLDTARVELASVVHSSSVDLMSVLKHLAEHLKR